MAGRAFISSEVVEASHESDRGPMWVPLLDGVDRIGVLELEVPATTDEVAGRFRHLASIAAAELIARGQYSDIYTITRRQRAMSLAAEMQWQVLPPNSFAVRDLSVAAMLEPAYDVGGDAFDYAYQDGVLQFAIFDAVGHGLESSLMSTLTVGTYRHRRRSGDELDRTARAIDTMIADQFGDARYATGQLGRVDVSSGRLTLVNAGHPPPLLIRNERVVGPLTCPPRLPFGLGHLAKEPPGPMFDEQLEPGDALLLYTDGVVEARRSRGSDFGLERLEHFLHRALASGLPVAEMLRRLSHEVLDYYGGQLQDDASMLLVRWHPAR